jgi:hypothetical protein
MKRTKPTPGLDRLMAPLGECITPDTARRLIALKADPTVQARVEELAGRNTAGALSPEELAEYRNYVSFGTFVAILKSKARQVLAAAPKP